jgi:hypothetical protein
LQTITRSICPTFDGYEGTLFWYLLHENAVVVTACFGLLLLNIIFLRFQENTLPYFRSLHYPLCHRAVDSIHEIEIRGVLMKKPRFDGGLIREGAMQKHHFLPWWVI